MENEELTYRVKFGFNTYIKATSIEEAKQKALAEFAEEFQVGLVEESDIEIVYPLPPTPAVY